MKKGLKCVAILSLGLFAISSLVACGRNNSNANNSDNTSDTDNNSSNNNNNNNSDNTNNNNNSDNTNNNNNNSNNNNNDNNDNNDDNNDDNEVTYVNDSDYHWTEKGDYLFVTNYAKHIYADGVCSTCGYEKTGPDVEVVYVAGQKTDIIVLNEVFYTLNPTTNKYDVIGIDDNCTDETITIVESINGVSVTQIARYAFINNTTCKNLYIPKTVNVIENSAFYHTALEKVYFGGTKNQFNAISIKNEDANPLQTADLYVKGATEYTKVLD